MKAVKKKTSAWMAKAKAEKDLAAARKKDRASELLDMIARRKTRILEDFYDIGVALTELNDKQLYLALGFKSFAELLEKHDVMGYSQAKRLMTVVAKMPRAQAVKLGQERAYALVAYTSATPEADDPAELAKKDVLIGGKPISQASVRHLASATKRVRATRRAKEPPSQEERAAAAMLRAARPRITAAMSKLGIARPKIETRGSDTLIVISAAQLGAIAKKR